MSKRKNGEGSWGKKTFKGVTYQYYRDANGQYTYAKTLKELKAKLNSKNRNSISASRNTFQGYILNYLKNFVKSNVSARTYDQYESYISRQISDFSIAHMQMQAVTTLHLQMFLNEMAEVYSFSTIKGIWQVCRQAIEYAEVNKVISPNTLFGIKLPKESNCSVRTKDVPFTSHEDMEILWNESFKKSPGTGSRVYGVGALMVDFIMYTGLRVSECCAIKLKNIDLVKRELTVSSTLSKVYVRDKNGNIQRNKNGTRQMVKIDKKPKTSSSERVIPLSSRALEIINLILSENPGKGPDDYLFLTSRGMTCCEQTVYSSLRSLMGNSSCSRKDYSPHSLRHGFGSILISKGADIKLVSELLGHTDVSFTYNVYIGIYDDDKRKAIDLLD